MRIPPGARFQLLLAATAVWCVAMPFFWAYNLDKRYEPALDRYFEYLSLYLPDLVTGGLFALCVPLVFLRPLLAAAGFAFAGVLAPVLHYAAGSPAAAWPVATTLLLSLALRLYVHGAKRAPAPADEE